MASPKPVIAILSVGDMGVGIGRLLISNDYRVVTNASGRSEWTVKRAQEASIELLDSDIDVVQEADYILSIVPPRDAISVADRIKAALASLPKARTNPLYFLDLNAISPTTVQKCASVFADDKIVRFVDGSIIGGPPRMQEDRSWYRPSIPVAGMYKLQAELSLVLNSRSISEEVGKASGLKMCFASLAKGFTALAVQSFSSAEAMGVLPELRRELQVTAPALGQQAEKSLLGFPPKAYRWVREMEEIAATFSDSGFGSEELCRGGTLFNAISEVYRFVAEDTSCGKERIGKRSTTTTDEVIADITRSLSQ